MKISVIIPTLNAEKHMPELLTRLQRQSRLSHEIIVIDSTSDDQTALIAKQHGARIVLVERQHFDHGATRNLAESQATGDILVYMTQDALPADEYFLERLTDPLKQPGVAASYGRQLARLDAGVLEKIVREFNYPSASLSKSMKDVERLGIKTFFLSNVCAAYRRDVFQKLGGFDQPMISNEDMLMSAKCIIDGYSVVYAAEASVYHSHDYSISQQFRRYFDIGVSIQLNGWILRYAKPEGEGGRLLRRQLRYLLNIKNWYRIPGWLAESAAKYVGYRLGLRHERLPRSTRVYCSMHKNFWKLQDAGNAVAKPETKDEKIAL